MPNKNIDTSPGPTVRRKLMGGSMASPIDNQYNNWDALNQEWANMERTMPNESAKLNTIRPMTMDESKSGAYALKLPMNVIAMNKDLIDKNKANVGDIMTHELTHVGNNDTSFTNWFRNMIGSSNDYMNRPEEIKARDAASNRKIKRTDINLPLETGPSSSQMSKLMNRR